METKQTRGLGALSRRAKLALTLTQPFEEDPNSNSDLGSGSDYGLLLLRELLARIASLAGREDKKKNARNLGSPPGLFVHRPEIEELELKLGSPSPSFPPPSPFQETFLIRNGSLVSTIETLHGAMQSLDATSAEESVDELLEREDVLIRVLPDIKTTATITEESANPDLYESHVGGFVFFDNSEPMNPVTLVLAHSHEVSQCLPYLNIEANRPPMSSLAFANLTRLRPRLQKTNPIQFPAQNEWHAHSHRPTIKASKYASLFVGKYREMVLNDEADTASKSVSMRVLKLKSQLG